MKLEIVPFGEEHLEPAAELVAARQVRLRRADAALPERWCDPAEARTLVEAAASADGAHGVAAWIGGSLGGFLVGAPRIDATWDRSAWVELAGHAVAPDLPDLARDLYAAWSARIVRELGITRHLVNVPASDPAAIEAWHQLDFGQMHANALRSTDASDLGPPAPGIRVRRAGASDAAILEATSEVIWREQVGPPSWSPIAPERIASLRGDYVSELEEQDDLVAIAEDDVTGEALGVTISYRLDPELDVPDDNMKLASTTTFASARRRGVARELLRFVLENAAARGAAWCATDWRTSSLLASRSWTALGFRRTRLRLERRIDERIHWADGRE
jgi:ribosomal protein S18 acetylase RimI-like enzyme